MRRLETDIRFVYDDPWLLTLKSYGCFNFSCEIVSIRERGKYCHVTFYGAFPKERDATMTFGDVFVCEEVSVE